MNEWYLPIYILPGIGLLIMSTALLQSSLSSEVAELLKDDVESMKEIIGRKINQISLLNKSLVGFYISAATFVLAGLIQGFAYFSNLMTNVIVNILIFTGVFSALISLIFLSIFSLRAVKIKKNNFILSLIKMLTNNAIDLSSADYSTSRVSDIYSYFSSKLNY